MTFRTLLGIALLILSATCGRWGVLAIIGNPRLPESRFRYWDWNLWAICQSYAALIGGVYFLAAG